MYIYRIAVLPTYQGGNLGVNIVDYALNYSKNIGKELYLDCWAGNKKLRNFYSSSGFQMIGEVQEEDYFISVFKSV
ncbi:GNAT family N-acetyltransferase [Clostridium sp. D2Q-11]|uniref:GNAT family N-acetyltransferase n=1 Tax=Anaeromonas frigoriresistens TaxID=2683708 RepID=A0A942Z7Q7_9FIRM|nr:GNAT family N-acetyltransferase [Anaeromonas frigoriresistens]